MWIYAMVFSKLISATYQKAIKSSAIFWKAFFDKNMKKWKVKEEEEEEEEEWAITISYC